MARLIVKSPYIKCGRQNAGGYLRYIATRERAEIIPNDRPPARKQEQLIKKLAKDFPDVKELWVTWAGTKSMTQPRIRSMTAASVKLIFISLAALRSGKSLFFFMKKTS